MNLESLAHGSVLPASLVEKVPQREKLILSFVLAFLKEQRLPAQLLVNGGYVRDLLLGKTPDDLDLSLCLRDCPADVSLASVMAGMEGFAKGRPELQVSSVQITTILSDTSKDKNIDTAKAHLGVGKPPVRVEVDFMPTIGEETYDETDRVPTRDVRGTPEQDALRRDLTIGALLLEVSAAAEAEDLDAHAAAKGMSWKLLDYYGGLADLRRGVLRSPYPRGRRAADVWAEVIRSAHELLPPHMRGQLMSQLHVLCRLRGEAVPLVQSEQLVQYLAGPCDGLLERLYDEWYEEEEAPAPAGSAPSGKGSGGTRKRQLKPPYAGPQRGKKK